MKKEEIKKHSNIARLGISRGIEKGEKGISRDEKHSRGIGVIRGFAVMTKGFVKDMRGWEIDDTTLEQIVSSGNAPSLGLKARFGHPNMSNEALGTLLGRVKNFRKDDDIVRADLFMDDTAYKTPNGDLATYILDLAENDPDAFGSSVVLGDYELAKRLNDDGTEKKDENGKALPPLLRVKKLFATDIVDDPAANDGLFAYGRSVTPSAEMTAFLDKFLTQPEAVEKTICFLEKYGLNRKQTEKTEEVSMELESITLEQLKKGRPDLFQAAFNEGLETGKAQGIDLENKRVVDILSAAKGFTELGDLPFSAVKDRLDAKDATISFQHQQLEGLKKKDVSVGPENNTEKKSVEVKNSVNMSKEELRQREHIARAREYRKGNVQCSMEEALRATYVEP